MQESDELLRRLSEGGVEFVIVGGLCLQHYMMCIRVMRKGPPHSSMAANTLAEHN